MYCRTSFDGIQSHRILSTKHLRPCCRFGPNSQDVVVHSEEAVERRRDEGGNSRTSLRDLGVVWRHARAEVESKIQELQSRLSESKSKITWIRGLDFGWTQGEGKLRGAAGISDFGT